MTTAQDADAEARALIVKHAPDVDPDDNLRVSVVMAALNTIRFEEHHGPFRHPVELARYALRGWGPGQDAMASAIWAHAKGTVTTIEQRGAYLEGVRARRLRSGGFTLREYPPRAGLDAISEMWARQVAERKRASAAARGLRARLNV